jgi:ribonuclease P protein component
LADVGNRPFAQLPVDVQPHSSAPSNSSSASRQRDSEAVERAGSIAGKFRRSAKLLRHADFQRVYKLGRRHFGTHMTVFYLKRDDVVARPPSAGTPHVGFTVGRVLGGAVKRNRIKRRMREAVRANLPALTVPVDVVINPKKTALAAAFPLLCNEVARAFAVIQEKCSAKSELRRDGST